MSDANRLKENSTNATPENLRRVIAEQAYYLAEQRGFAGGSSLGDWLEAEARIHHIYGKPVVDE
ncbi:DUF2934 domain-containing protein [Mariprofundus sp. NF]|uniref:DUF2934 domain-containing protein n=1 Tax=Mariprofundus sp. NF TaxID=2608716 RepID=UPI0015A1A6CF|nr:DUF2934 domain-containing protein [Mariprofundus sp. NF]NWF37559.1 DUF2934 domain-containing protein [Mariprofundus sp. NF]